jgi:hypothetical protein
MKLLKFRRFLGTSVIALAVSCVPFLVPSVATAQTSPEATLTAFYKWYLRQLRLEHYPRPTTARVNAAISTRLRKWFKSGEGREWDADYFIDAQDWDPKWETHINVTKAVTNGNNADVRVILGPRVKAVNSMSPHTLRIKMVKEKDGWKIDHINGY